MTLRAEQTLEVEGGRPLRGELRVPGDKSVSHRALIIGSIAQGVSLVRGRSDGDDVLRTENAMRAIGATVEGESIAGGVSALHQPVGSLDLGNSGTSMRLVAGVVAARSWVVELTGDASLSQRPMDRVAIPLRLMGADVDGRTDLCLPPIRVRGGSLRGIEYELPVASAQVKSCVLLAGLNAEGPTTVREPVKTRVHTEEILTRAGMEISETSEGAAHVVRLLPGRPRAFELDVPADPSQAAFWLVAACITPASEVTLRGVYTGGARRGFLEVLTRMGAHLTEVSTTRSTDLSATADITAREGKLVATEVSASEITGLDEVPVLAVAAARAEGTTVFHDAGELRLKESDRFEAVLEMVRSFGASAEPDGDDIFVTGVSELRPAEFDSRGDHRMAMAAAVAASSIRGGRSRIVGWNSVMTSYPGFVADLDRLTGGR